jgi:hypothetical protein
MSQRSEAAASPYAAELAAAKKAVSLAARLCQVLILGSLLSLLCGGWLARSSRVLDCWTVPLFCFPQPSSSIGSNGRVIMKCSVTAWGSLADS